MTARCFHAGTEWGKMIIFESCPEHEPEALVEIGYSALEIQEYENGVTEGEML